MSDSLLQSANSLLQLGRSPEALTWYESYLKSHPESAEAWHNHGIALSQMQRFPEAVVVYPCGVSRGQSPSPIARAQRKPSALFREDGESWAASMNTPP